MAEKIGAHLMQNEQRLQKKIAELQKDWDKLGEMLSAFKRERILETRVEEKIRLDQKIKETIVERQSIEQELDKLETQLEQLQAEPEKREPPKARADFEVEQKTPQQQASAQPEPERPKVTEKGEPERWQEGYKNRNSQTRLASPKRHAQTDGREVLAAMDRGKHYRRCVGADLC
jgi:hypothetical protein